MVELSRALARCKDSEDDPSEQASAEALQDAGLAMLRLHTLHSISRQLFERHRQAWCCTRQSAVLRPHN